MTIGMSGTKPFQLVTKNCRKNDALFSSVIPHAQALKNFIGHQARCVLDLNAATNLAKKRKRRTTHDPAGNCLFCLMRETTVLSTKAPAQFVAFLFELRTG